MTSTSSTLRPLLKKLQLWQEFDPQEQAAILALPHSVETISAGKYIVREGDRPKHVCVLLSGFAFRQKITGDGSRSINAVHMTGDVVDLQNSLLRIADHNVQALTQAEVAFIPREHVVKLAFERPKVGMAMWYDMLVDGSVFREWIANIARRDAATRLAHLLCEVGIRLEAMGLAERESFELPMTQEQLADATGLTPVHVNRTLKELESRGVITRTVRFVAVADWAQLEKTGDFSDAYLHLPKPESLLN
jgi:CRP-like cAMP-binding protein